MSEHKVRPGPASLLRPTWFEIDLDAIAHNLRQLRRMVGSGVAIYACLKRNAYGCGAVPVAQVMQREGADAIAVGNINDALAIRQAQITLPVLLYPNCLASQAGPAVIRHRLMPTISSLDDVAAWEQAADGGTLDAFAKIDVGLFRGGAMPREALALLRRIADSNVLGLAGAYAHLHGYDPATGDDYADWQFRNFQTVMREAASSGIDVPVRMVASTSVVLQHPEMDLNGVEPRTHPLRTQTVPRAGPGPPAAPRRARLEVATDPDEMDRAGGCRRIHGAVCSAGASENRRPATRLGRWHPPAHASTSGGPGRWKTCTGRRSGPFGTHAGRPDRCSRRQDWRRRGISRHSGDGNSHPR